MSPKDTTQGTCKPEGRTPSKEEIFAVPRAPPIKFNKRLKEKRRTDDPVEPVIHSARFPAEPHTAFQYSN